MNKIPTMTELAKVYAAAIARVREFLAKNATWSPSGLAKASGLSINALRHIHSAKWRPSIATLDAVLRKIDDLERRAKPRPNHRPSRANLVEA